MFDRRPPPELYAQVAEELKNDHKDEGLMLKSFAEASGDESKALARYIDARARSIWHTHEEVIKENENKQKHLERIEAEKERAKRTLEVTENSRLESENLSSDPISTSLGYIILTSIIVVLSLLFISVYYSDAELMLFLYQFFAPNQF